MVFSRPAGSCDLSNSPGGIAAVVAQFSGLFRSQTARLSNQSFALAMIALFCAPALFALAQGHWNTEAGSLTPLILLLGFWTLWRVMRNTIDLAKPGPLRPALAGLLAVSLVYVLAGSIKLVLLMAFCAWAGCVLAMWGWLGSAMVIACRFPLFFLGLAVPLPYSLSIAMTEKLRVFMAEQAVWIADGFNLDVALDRTSIFVNQFRLALEAACAGTSSTISLIAFVLLFTYWYSGQDWRRTAISVILSIPIALGANILRVFTLIIAVEFWGAPVLATIIHPFAGVLSFSMALGLFLLADRVTRAALQLVDALMGKAQHA